MYKRSEELKSVLDSIPEFSDAIYDEGILRDIRFKFIYQNETFLLIYKFDYTTPRLYRIRKDKLLTETKDVIVPKEIKQKIDEITTNLQAVNGAYYPLVPGQKKQTGSVVFVSKYLNEYANADRIIDYISTTYKVYVNDEKVNEVEMSYLKKTKGWVLEKEKIQDEENGDVIRANLSIFQNDIENRLNKFEETEDLLMKAADLFLKGHD
ncbi:hypothetical protein CN918_25270 [Priestia megaterium]|nr:hypothetical protein CN918_25270 [Priestia megaterium]